MYIQLEAESRRSEFLNEDSSAKLLEVSLGDQAFHVALSDIELAVFRQVDGAVV
jgi:hypothetical protein